jgi:hypothetical protein
VSDSLSPLPGRNAYAAAILDDPARMLEILQRHLPISETRGPRVTDCTVSNIRRRDGTRGSVQFEIRLEDPASDDVWTESVTGLMYGSERTRRVWDVIRASMPSAVNALDPMHLRPYAYVPELDMLLQVFPHDHRLPALAMLISRLPEELTEALLQAFGAGDWRLVSHTVETVQYRPDMRAILRLRVSAVTTDGRSESREFYAKIYRDAEHAQQSFDVHLALTAAISGSAAPLAVPKPVCHLAALRTVVTQAVPGVSLSKIIRRGGDTATSLRLAAEAVAAFHQLEAPMPPRSADNDLARLREAGEFLTSARPDLATDVATLVESVAGGLQGAPIGVIHGDLKPDHILIDDEAVAVIDFDLAGGADPVIDIAHFVAFLGRPQERSRQRGGSEGDAATAFLEEYFAGVPDSWRSRLRLYHAMTSVHKAVGICRRRGAAAGDHVDLVIQEGLELLAGYDGQGSTPTFKRRLTRTVAH